MDPSHELAIRRAAVLTYHLAAIERALEVAPEPGGQLLPITIHQALARAEEIAADELARCRRLIRGEY